MYYIGIHNSTYSRLSAMNDSDKIIGRHAGNHISLNSSDYDKARSNIKKLVTEFNRMTNTEIENCGAICVGSEDIYSKDDSDYLSELFKAAGITCPVIAEHEAKLYIAAGTKDDVGAVILANQSSKGFGVDREGSLTRVGGWGHMIDDGGSAFRIGMDVIRYVLMSHDGRLPKTIMTEHVMNHFGITKITDVAELVYSGKIDNPRISELVVIAKKAADKADFLAEEIELKAAKELYRIAESLIVQLGLQNDRIITAGTVFRLDERIRDYFNDMISQAYPHAQVTQLTEKPETGGIYIAKKSLTADR